MSLHDNNIQGFKMEKKITRNRPIVHNTNFNVRIANDILNEFKEYCSLNDETPTIVIRRAIETYIKHRKDLESLKAKFTKIKEA